MTRKLILLVSASVLLTLAVPAHAETAPVYTIVGHVVYENGAFVFYDPIVVPAGASLTFRNATVHLDYDCPTTENCPAAIRVAGGVLRIEQGSVIDTHVWDPANFEDGYRISSESGQIVATDSTFIRWGLIAVWDQGPGRSSFVENDFLIGWGPVHFRTSSVDFVGNRMDDIVNGALQIDGASATIDGNSITNAAPWFPVVVRDLNDVAASVTFTDNLLADLPAPVVWQAKFGGLIEGNLFRDMGRSLVVQVYYPSILSYSPPMVRHNSFMRSGPLEVAESAAGPQVAPATMRLDARENSFEAPDCQDVWVRGPGIAQLTLDVDLRGSWWGSALGPESHGPACPSAQVDAPGTIVQTSPFAAARPAWVREG